MTDTVDAARDIRSAPRPLAVACTVCEAQVAEPAYQVNSWQIVRCRSCAHLYVSPRPSMEAIQQIYGNGYFDNPAFMHTDGDAYVGYMDYLGDRDHITVKLREMLSRINQFVPDKGRLLDIGCGPGLLVGEADAAGWDAWGVDLNESAVQWANENISKQVRYGTAATLELPDNSVDCVCMLDLIEHLGDPRAELADIRRILRPGGLLVVLTPDAGSIVSRLLGSHWLEMRRAPEHLHFFSSRTLSRLLTSSGFEPIDAHSVGKTTSVRVILADLKFYGAELFNTVERILDKAGLAERVISLDPHTKMCCYARLVPDDEEPRALVPKVRFGAPWRPARH